MLRIKIAGLSVEIDNKYGYIENLAKDYLTENGCDFKVSVSSDKIAQEKNSSPYDNLSDGYCESICIYREIAERLPEYDAFVFHGCAIAHAGCAYLFTAQSGVGKTTHARNWLSRFGNEVHILNGDKPIIRIIDGAPYVSGTPWQGKENYGVNETLPLKAIVFLERGETNVASVASKSDCLVKLMKQIYLPRANAVSLSKTMRLADKILDTVSLLRLSCNKEEESAQVAFNALIK